MVIICFMLILVTGDTSRVKTIVTVAGGYIEAEIIYTIVYKFIRLKLLDAIQPEKYPNESSAEIVAFERDSSEMDTFLEGLKLHAGCKLSYLQNTKV